MQAAQLKMLQARIEEFAYYAEAQQFSVEPERYPNGLFRAQRHSVKRYQLMAYIEELKSDLAMLTTGASYSSLKAQHLLQKISVLITSFRSQVLRNKSRKQDNFLLGKIDLLKDSAYDFIAGKPRRKNTSISSKHINDVKHQLVVLEKNKKQMLFELHHAPTDVERANLQATLLDITQKIGQLNQRLTLEQSKQHT